MWATWMNDPDAGPEIIDLSIFPFFVDFFLVGDEKDLAERTVLAELIQIGLMRRTFLDLSAIDLLMKRLSLIFLSKDHTDHAFLHEIQHKHQKS
jgi:hypothetical protein